MTSVTPIAGGPTYACFTVEPDGAPEGLDNLDSLKFEPPPCPLCGSAYVSVMAHHGPSSAWLECYLGHCVITYPTLEPCMSPTSHDSP